MPGLELVQVLIKTNLKYTDGHYIPYGIKCPPSLELKRVLIFLLWQMSLGRFFLTSRCSVFPLLVGARCDFTVPLVKICNVQSVSPCSFFILTLVVGMFFWTCSKQPEQPLIPTNAADQRNYFPLSVGKYVEFAIDSVLYDFGGSGGTSRDSIRTWVREEITDTFTDNLGQPLFRIERFERKNDSLPWQLKQVLSASLSIAQAIRTENNLRFLKLVFPFYRNTRWDGNLWIDPYLEIEVAGERIRPFTNWQYKVDALDIPAQIGAFAFDSVLVVTEVDQTNAIERRLSRSTYAKHIGLVQREQWILDSQYCNQIPAPADCQSKPWIEKAETGYILRQVLTGYN